MAAKVNLLARIMRMPKERWPKKIYHYIKQRGKETRWMETVRKYIDTLGIITGDLESGKWKKNINKRRNLWEQEYWQEKVSLSNSLSTYPKEILQGRANYINMGQGEKWITKIRINDIGMFEKGGLRKCTLCQKTIALPSTHVLGECQATREDRVQRWKIKGDTTSQEEIRK